VARPHPFFIHHRSLEGSGVTAFTSALQRQYPIHRLSRQTGRNPFDGLFFKTTWVSQHQKGKINLDFNEATDDGVAVASAGPYANHLYLASDR